MAHDFSSTQVDFPDWLSALVRARAAKIPDSHLSEDGRENDSHVTVKYGLHASDPGPLKALLANESPIKVKLGKASLFPPNKEQGFEVVKYEIESPDLHRLNKKIAGAMETTDTHPVYHPHATIAYVKIGKGKQHAGGDALEGKEFTASHIVFSSKDGTKTKIPLGRTGRKYYGE